MKLKVILAAGTALAMLVGAGAAFADSNKTRVIQSDVDNNASITQTGASNVAGSIQYSDWAMHQTGDNNTIDVDQSGNGNSLGTIGISYGAGYGRTDYSTSPGTPVYPPVYKRVSGSSGPSIKGVYQIGDYNQLSVTQVEGSHYGDGNIGGRIKQQASDVATGPTNVLTITQDNGDGTPGSAAPYEAGVSTAADYAYNVVGKVYQNNTGSGAAGDENKATIGQHTDHLGGYAHGNRMDILTQDGVGNMATVTQIGLGNIVNYLMQEGLSSAGADNAATINQTGGNDNWVGTARQQGGDNLLTITQTGMSNEVGALTQQGDGNEAQCHADRHRQCPGLDGAGQQCLGGRRQLRRTQLPGQRQRYQCRWPQRLLERRQCRWAGPGSGHRASDGRRQLADLHRRDEQQLVRLQSDRRQQHHHRQCEYRQRQRSRRAPVRQQQHTANFTQSGGGNNISISQ